MGNHRLRLSDMMPNAWLFNKLSQPQRNQPIPTKKPTNPQAHSPPNHHLLQPLVVPSRDPSSSSPLHPKAFDTHFPLGSPRKSTTHKPRTIIPAIVTSSPLSISSSCRGSDSDSDSDSDVPSSSYCITTKNDVTAAADISQHLDLDLELPPIITKPAKKLQTAAKETTVDAKPKKAAPAIRRLRTRTSSTSPRTRTRTSSSAAAKKVRVTRKKSGLSESFAVVKSTSDPRSDFRESVMEMIEENGLVSSNELEDLLACYLSLNSNEYHDVIVGVFEEICFDISTDFVSKF